MAESTKLVSRADQLMRRHHSAPSPMAAEKRPGKSSPDEDLPVLTEIVEKSPLPLAAAPGAGSLRQEGAAAMVDEIARTVERQLAAELPVLLEATLLKVGEELRRGLAATVESALREFKARHDKGEGN